MRSMLRKLAGRGRRSLGIEQTQAELTQLRTQLNEIHETLGRVLETQTTLLAISQQLQATSQRSSQFERLLQAPDGTASRVAQLTLANQYRELVEQGRPLPGFSDVEFRAFSQNGEDGLLLYVFSLIGMGGRRCVEICGADGLECNTANLIINHGWHGLLFDGNDQLIERGRKFYAEQGDTRFFPPTFVHAWITRDNINNFIQNAGFTGEIDLLSLDIDGNDYWIWNAINVVRPRVVIAEFQCIWGADEAVTVPYADDFQPKFIDGFGLYCGASLPAFVKLAKSKGYRLVGVQNLGFNAIFVADGVGEKVLPEVDAASCLNDLPFVKFARTLLPKVQHFDWVRV